MTMLMEKLIESMYAGLKPSDEFCKPDRDEQNTPKLDLPNGTLIETPERFVHRVGYRWMYRFVPGQDRIKIAARLYAQQTIKKPRSFSKEIYTQSSDFYYLMVEQETKRYEKFLLWTNQYGTGFEKSLRSMILAQWIADNNLEKDEWRRLWYKEMPYSGMELQFRIVGRKNFRTGKFYKETDYGDREWGSGYIETYSGLNPMYYQHLYVVEEINGYLSNKLIHPLDVEVKELNK